MWQKCPEARLTNSPKLMIEWRVYAEISLSTEKWYQIINPVDLSILTKNSSYWPLDKQFSWCTLISFSSSENFLPTHCQVQQIRVRERLQYDYFLMSPTTIVNTRKMVRMSNLVDKPFSLSFVSSHSPHRASDICFSLF